MTPRISLMSRYIVALIAIVAIGAGIGFAERALSADTPQIPEHAAVENQEPQYMGSQSCALCHSKVQGARTSSELATLDEFTTWDAHDQHRKAFDALKSDCGKQMGIILGMNAATDRKCLACHALQVTEGSAGLTLPDGKSQRAAIEQGVSCEACHGRASLWIDRHWKKGEWSGLKSPEAEQKYDKYGMTNLRDPVRRTELCLSCHVGDIDSGKFVTHDMFAAGHPPLPAFEVESFLEQMPPHWRQVAPGSRTRSVALEGLVMLRASVKLLADANKPTTDHANDHAADFAIYDCAACHHELEFPSHRQQRGYSGGVPGRPPLRSCNSPLAAAMIGLPATNDDKITPTAIGGMTAQLQIATHGRPFGDPEAVAAAATQVKGQLEKAIEMIHDKLSKGRPPISLIERICRAGAETPLDYESAWQLTGALRAVAADMAQAADMPLDPKIKSLIDELSALVHFPSPPDYSNTQSSAEHHTLWANGTNFDSAEFRKKLEEIVKLLPARQHDP